MGSLQDDIAACGEGIFVRAAPGCDPLVAFGGLAQQLGMPPWEFLGVALSLPETGVIFCRDFEQAWYHAGITGAGATVDEAAAHLRSTIAQVRPRRVVTTGTSAGGYAALLFGELIGAHESHAFGPQTFLDPVNRARYGERRWPRLRDLWEEGRLDPRYCDLAEVVAGTRTRHHVWYGDPADEAHVRHLGDRVTVERVGRKHNTAATLRKTGRLAGVLDAALRRA